MLQENEMIMKQTTPYSLIAKFLANQCSASDIAELTEWRNALPDNEKIFTELSAEWDLAHKDYTAMNIIPDKQKIWNNIQQRISGLSINYSKSFVLKVASIAASIALMVGLSISIFLNNQEIDVPTLTSTFIAPQGQKSQILLADGTKVWLNSGTSLTYTNKFGEKDRSVGLEGEAFFEVTKDADLKFIVNTGEVNVVVHGTAFNVKSYPSDNQVSVSLLEGKVDVVASNNNKSIAVLSPGEKVIVEKSNMKSFTEKCNADLEGIWRNERLRFEGSSITEVAEKLGKWYGVDIKVLDVNNFHQYWFTVKNESLSEILRSMNSLHPIKYTITNNDVVITSR
jgi:transmembrane sensor